MRISRTWLQKYFDTELPSAEVIADALTFHAFEIEEVDGEVLDIKVLPDRAAYALSHRGIATEVAANLKIPLVRDPLREALPTWTPADELVLTRGVEDKVNRKMGALVRGVRVGPSPSWLKEALESVGARSINNVVDATNYVTLNMGQPLHAFDAKKITWHDSKLHITVRGAAAGEKITVLTGETYTLPEGALVIAEAVEGTALDIAGIKGGAASAITEDTTDLFVSVANFDGPSVRKTAQALNLFTDASLRFQNKISPELAAYGMRDVLALIQEVAGGEVVGVNDVYGGGTAPVVVSVSLDRVNRLLGTALSSDDIESALARLGLSFVAEGNVYTVTPSFERRDLVIDADLIEEIGRIIGYDAIASAQLSPIARPLESARYAGVERIRDLLRMRGYTEISTQSFASTGDIMLANPLDVSKPALRTALSENMQAALARAVQLAPRVLGPSIPVRLFEIGSVFPKDGEHLSLVIGYAATAGKTKEEHLSEILDALNDELGLAGPVARTSESVAELSLRAVDLESLGRDYAPLPFSLGTFRMYSIYPFALRDIAVWTPEGTAESEVANQILKEAGDNLVRIDLFDRFEKDSRISYAFRLVFESKERTLSDADLDPAMARVTQALNSQEGWTVR
ncbi:MAG TPA: phenylalanine--tRNA ligase subunit beta [Candidatus Paceibacterota bacterium]|nr:phenylalanine--tRNA ligase subunit beta [Candidatus Paceibacterota bacterium]